MSFSLYWRSRCVGGFQYIPIFSDSLIYRVPQTCPLPHPQARPLISCLHFLFFLSFFPSASAFAHSPRSLSFRVTWRLALVNRAEMSTTPWCCTTTTAPAGLSRSSCPSRSTCSGGRTSGLSSGTAPVSGNTSWITFIYVEAVKRAHFSGLSHISRHRLCTCESQRCWFLVS